MDLLAKVRELDNRLAQVEGKNDAPALEFEQGQHPATLEARLNALEDRVTEVALLLETSMGEIRVGMTDLAASAERSEALSREAKDLITAWPGA